ncbi:MAG: Uma2 family endonuclease [Bacteroidota bacterium]
MSIKEQISKPAIIYPDSDGKPMADNTLQFEWIAKIKGALEFVFKDQVDVFVAGDLLWYPVEGNPKERKAPDALVVFGRPKGYRGSYKQWEEANIPPKVVFEVMSPSHDLEEMLEKHRFYYKYGVEEFYVLDPENSVFWVWTLSEKEPVSFLHKETKWYSKLLDIRISVDKEGLGLFFPSGDPILSYAQTREMFEQTREMFEQTREMFEQTREALEAEKLAKEKALQREQQALAEIERLKAALNKKE